MVDDEQMLNMLQAYTETNPEKFNEDFIYLKKNDPILPYLDHICKALEIIDGITYLGSEINTDESTHVLKKIVESDEEQTSNWMSIDDSRLDLITLKFRIEKEDNNVRNKDKLDADGIRREDIELKLLFPKLIDDFYFIINGTKYFPIYQIIDAGTYVTNSKALTLKSLFMPIVIRHKNASYTTLCGKKFSGRYFLIDLFRNKTNILYYLYAKMGFEDTVEFLLNRNHKIMDKLSSLNLSIKDLIHLSDTPKDDSEGYYSFKINSKLHLNVLSEIFDDSVYLRDISFSIINSFANKKIRFEDENYWKKNLGRIFSTNTSAQLEKSEKMLLSFERIMDSCTKDNLRIDDQDKESTYAIVRWMMLYFDKLSKLDNMDLANKRIRQNEYLITPFLLKLSTGTYRALNSKNPTFSSIKSILNNIGPNFIIRKLVKNELLRYSNTVNTIALFSSAMKFSFKGPSSFAENSDSVEDKLRAPHPSYIGNVGLVDSSSSDPGDMYIHAW